MHFAIYESVWFTWLIPTWYSDDSSYWTLHFNLILVQLTLTLIQNHRSARKQRLPWQFGIDFDGMWYAVETCWIWWTSCSYYLIHSVFKGENPTISSILYFLRENPTKVVSVKKKKKKNPLILSCIQTFTERFIQSWCDDRDCCALHFGIRLNDLDIHSRSQ